MKCYNHPQNEAVAQCVDCGKGLCHECSTKWEIPICDYCQNSRGQAELSSINREIMLYVGLAILGMVFGFFMASSLKGDNGALILIPLYGISFPIYAAGWKWMNHLTDRFSLLATPFVWVIYLLVKLIFSAMVGVFALPYRLYYIHKRKAEINSVLP